MKPPKHPSNQGPDPYRVGDMLGAFADEAQELVRLGITGDVWTDHDGQDTLRRSPCVERAVTASNRWGKSDWGARETRYWLLGDHPYLSEFIHPPTFGWAVSDTLENGRDIVVPKLTKHIPYEAVRHYPTTQARYFELTTGSKVLLKSCEQGRGAFQGVGNDFNWWDDIEGDNPDLAWICYKEGGMRIQAGKALWQWITMTPLCGLTPLIASLQERAKLGKVFMMEGSIYDNPHLDDEARERALSGITEEWERQAREFGKVTLLGGNHVFPQEIVQIKSQQDEPPSARRTFSIPDGPSPDSPGVLPYNLGDAFLEAPAPTAPAHRVWKVWEPPKPDARYVVSVDPAGGGLASEDDWTCLKVFDSSRICEVACLRSKLGTKGTAREAILISTYYNYALLGIEANAIGLGVIDECREYANLYRRHQVSDVAPQAGSKLGWHTSEILKEKMCKDLAELIIANQVTLREKETWVEMTTFIRNHKGRLGHMAGKHDDGVTCAAMGIQIIMSPQLTSYFRSLRLAGH